jgi:release factor glutamine methyltransferase
MPSIKELLFFSYKKLKNSKTAHLDAEVILSSAINKPREYILAHGDKEINEKKSKEFKKMILLRSKMTPVAYITKKKWFYGREFNIDERAHIPRNSTESLVESVIKKVGKNFKGKIADICSGSGCISITLALEIPKATILASDISKSALSLAKKNARNFEVHKRINFFNGDLLDPIKEKIDIIVSNPPYGWISKKHKLNGKPKEEVWTKDKEVFFQPKESYDGGKNGLKAINAISKELPKKLTKNGIAFLEFDPRQIKQIKTIFKETLFNLEILKDFEGFDRIAVVKIK